jgi:hypothetical protein
VSDTGMPWGYILRREARQLPVGMADQTCIRNSRSCIDRKVPVNAREEHQVPQAWWADSVGTSGETDQLLNTKVHGLAAEAT